MAYLRHRNLFEECIRRKFKTELKVIVLSMNPFIGIISRIIMISPHKNECFEVSMDISGDNYLFSVRIFIVFHFVVKKLVINFAARQ